MLTQVWSSTICFSVASVATYSPSFFMFRVLLLLACVFNSFYFSCPLRFSFITSSGFLLVPTRRAYTICSSAKLEFFAAQKTRFLSMRGQENHYQSPSISRITFLWTSSGCFQQQREIKFPGVLFFLIPQEWNQSFYWLSIWHRRRLKPDFSCLIFSSCLIDQKAI